MDNILFVTGNRNKVAEATQILGYPLEIADIDLDEIQSLDINEVVMKKAETAYAILKKPLIVEDVGVFVNAWNGFPGPLIKFIHKSGNDSYELLLRMLDIESDKTAIVKAVIGYHDGKDIHITEGSFIGTFVDKKGQNGWGFDAYMIPAGYDKTFGELGDDVKNRISHRAKAFRNLKLFLDSQGNKNEE